MTVTTVVTAFEYRIAITLFVTSKLSAFYGISFAITHDIHFMLSMDGNTITTHSSNIYDSTRKYGSIPLKTY